MTVKRSILLYNWKVRERVFSVRLADIAPSDTPQSLKWIRVTNRYPSIKSIGSKNLDDHGVEIIKTRRDILTPFDGNHRIARLTELLSPLAIVTLTLKDAESVLRAEQDDWIDVARGLGVYSFPDFVNLCKKGAFIPVD